MGQCICHQSGNIAWGGLNEEAAWKQPSWVHARVGHASAWQNF
jgi:hypothetical protein